jgi:hypothetical protein
VYDSAGGSESFLRELDRFMKRMELEIERLCNKNYQGFIDSIKELLMARSNAERLQDIIARSSEAVQASGDVAVKVLEDLVAHRHMQRNILAAIEALTACLPALKLYNKAAAQLAAHRHYPTLRLLQELETSRLPAIAQYAFATKLRERIPQMRLKVKQASFTDLQNFLGDIRAKSRDIGEAAMTLTKQVQGLGGGGELAPVAAEVAQRPNSLADASAGDQGDFTPLYRCIHIFEVLGVRAESDRYYLAERSKQAELAFNPSADNNSVTMVRACGWALIMPRFHHRCHSRCPFLPSSKTRPPYSNTAIISIKWPAFSSLKILSSIPPVVSLPSSGWTTSGKKPLSECATLSGLSW